MKGSGDAQGFPELAGLSNEALAALLVDETKYNSLVDSIMASLSVAQVGLLPFSSNRGANSAASPGFYVPCSISVLQLGICTCCIHLMFISCCLALIHETVCESIGNTTAI